MVHTRCARSVDFPTVSGWVASKSRTQKTTLTNGETCLNSYWDYRATSSSCHRHESWTRRTARAASSSTGRTTARARRLEVHMAGHASRVPLETETWPAMPRGSGSSSFSRPCCSSDAAGGAGHPHQLLPLGCRSRSNPRTPTARCRRPERSNRSKRSSRRPPTGRCATGRPTRGRAHRVWLSPSGRTAFGVIRVNLPLPFPSPRLLLGPFLKRCARRRGRGGPTAGRATPDLPGLRFVAEGGRYTMRGNLISRGWRMGRLRGHPAQSARRTRRARRGRASPRSGTSAATK